MSAINKCPWAKGDIVFFQGKKYGVITKIEEPSEGVAVWAADGLVYISINAVARKLDGKIVPYKRNHTYSRSAYWDDVYETERNRKVNAFELATLRKLGKV